MGNSVAKLHFQTLRQHPSLKCFVQQGRSGNRWHGIKVNTIYRGQEYVDTDVFTALQGANLLHVSSCLGSFPLAHSFITILN